MPQRRRETTLVMRHTRSPYQRIYAINYLHDFSGESCLTCLMLFQENDQLVTTRGYDSESLNQLQLHHKVLHR